MVGKIYSMDDIEFAEFLSLRPIPRVGFRFWRRVAKRRGLDPETIISIVADENPSRCFMGHKKVPRQGWCWPHFALKAKKGKEKRPL